MMILVHTPPTKCGKRAMFLTLEDKMGLFEVVFFAKAQGRFAELILTSEVLTLEGKLQRQGSTGKAISVIMEKTTVGLCGPLTRLLGYVMHVRIPKDTRDFKIPAVKKALAKPETDECPTQLSLGF